MTCQQTEGIFNLMRNFNEKVTPAARNEGVGIGEGNPHKLYNKNSDWGIFNIVRKHEEVERLLNSGLTIEQITNLDLGLEVKMDLPKHHFRVVIG